MSEALEERSRSVLEAISTAMVRLHKEQFGRGPTRSRAHFAGPDSVVCVLRDALLPAERKMVVMGHQDRVRQTRMEFQAAAAEEFIAAVEQITGRTVIGFASGIDADNDVIFENFLFAAVAEDGTGNGTAPMRGPAV